MSDPKRVRAGEQFTAPAPPVVDTPIEGSPAMAYYEIRGELVGHWFQGEVVAADDLGDVKNRARLLGLGVIAPIQGTPTKAPISRADAWTRTGPVARPAMPTTEEIVARTIAALEASKQAETKADAAH